MQEQEAAYARHKNRTIYKEPQEENKIGKMFTKVLLSIIFLLSSVIFMKLDSNNKEIFKEQVFASNLAFTKINQWYHKTFGSILPSFQEPQTNMVSKDLETESTRENYLEGYKIKSSKNTPIKIITSGLLVYYGPKEQYGNCAIIQGVDGVDIWYGGIENTDFKLYDYIESGQIIGEVQEDYYYLLFLKDGKPLQYEDYLEEM